MSNCAMEPRKKECAQGVGMNWWGLVERSNATINRVENLERVQNIICGEVGI